MRRIYLSLIRPMRIPLLASLPEVLQRVFSLPVAVARSTMDISFAFDPQRQQYHGAAILLRLTENPPPDAARILGVTEADLFVPVFDFLFGEAQLDGLAAVMSTFRLRNENYGMPPDEDQFAERLYKEAIHELGHAFGLIHCFNPFCVMNPSTIIEQIDAKSREMCRQCEKTYEELLRRSGG
jgi:archaemetzincin